MSAPTRLCLLHPLAIGLLALFAGGCGLVLGLDDFHEGGSKGSGGAGGGGGGSSLCKAGDTIGCYSGAQGTEGHGACKAGKKTCLTDGNGYGDCVGELVPAPKDNCVDMIDTTCDEKLDCPCKPGTSAACYDGAAGTDAHLPCKSGTRACKDDGTAYGPCSGQVVPKGAEDCATAEDDNCDGVVNEMCVCKQGDTVDCYTADPVTKGTGVCVGGKAACNADGNGYQACAGEVTPTAEACGKQGDEDCDGVACSDARWGRIIQSGGNDEGFGPVYSVAVDDKGNTYVAGAFDQTNPPSAIDLGNGVTANGNTDAFVLAFDSTGQPLWARVFPIQVAPLYLTTRGTALAIAGSFSGSLTIGATSLTSAGGTDIFVALLNGADGTIYSAHRYGGAGDETVTAFGRGAMGEFAVGGTFTGSSTIGAVTSGPAIGNDALLFSVSDTSWNTFKVSVFGDKAGAPPGSQSISALGSDAGGNVIAAVTFTSSVKVGATDYVSVGGSDMAVFKILAAGGSPSWSAAFGSVGNDGVTTLSVDPGGTVFIAGYSGGALDFGGGNVGVGGAGACIAKLSAGGVHLWSNAFPALFGGIDSIAVDASGDVAILGRSGNGSVDLGGGPIAGTLLGKLSGAGAYRWSKGFGGSVVGLLAVDPVKKNISLAASNQATIALESGPLSSIPQDSHSIVVASFQP